jgi:hypothetical protein
LDEDYIARTEDVLALYEKPLSKKEPVICMDEKPVVLHAELRSPRPMRPLGGSYGGDCEYQCRGTANAFYGVEPKAGAAFYQGHGEPLCAPVRRVSARDRRRLSSR